MMIEHVSGHMPPTSGYCKLVALGLGLAVILFLPEGRQATAAEPPQVESLSESAETIEVDARKPIKRRRQRSLRKRKARRAPQPKPRSQSVDQVYGRMHFEGSFALEFGDKNIVRGNGSTTIELDRAAVDQLEQAVDEQLDRLGPMLTNGLQVIVRLPETLESTSQILNRLTDPQTQQQLRQVEQLLRLLPNNDGQPDPPVLRNN